MENGQIVRCAFYVDSNLNTCGKPAQYYSPWNNVPGCMNCIHLMWGTFPLIMDLALKRPVMSTFDSRHESRMQ